MDYLSVSTGIRCCAREFIPGRCRDSGSMTGTRCPGDIVVAYQPPRGTEVPAPRYLGFGPYDSIPR